MLAKYNCTVHSCGFISKAPGSHSIFWTTLSLLSSNKALCNLIWSLRVMSMIFINCAMQPCGSIFKASGSHSIAYYESISKSLCICMSCILSPMWQKRVLQAPYFLIVLFCQTAYTGFHKFATISLNMSLTPPPSPLQNVKKECNIVVGRLPTL